MVIRFEDMVGNPRQAFEVIADRLGIDIMQPYADILDKETAKSLQYISPHKYSLTEIGYTREQIINEFRDVFQRWHFDKDA